MINVRIEIVSKEENKLLDRVEVTYKAIHQNEKIPSREEARKQLAANLQVPQELIVIDHQEPKFGRNYAEGYAKIYKTREAAIALEPDYILIRNGLKEKKGE